jgi:hypothetical protein
MLVAVSQGYSPDVGQAARNSEGTPRETDYPMLERFSFLILLGSNLVVRERRHSEYIERDR